MKSSYSRHVPVCTLFICLLLKTLSASVSTLPREADAEFYSNRTSVNWTSCEQFVIGTQFNITDVIDVDWKIFYFWTIEYHEPYIFRFHYPSRPLVHRFRDALDEDMETPANWTLVEMFMETTMELSGLLIRTPISGIYRFIPSLSFERQIPPTHIGMKVVQPEGFLGMVQCESRLAYALSPVDKMPDAGTTNLTREAERLGFWNPYGHLDPEAALNISRHIAELYTDNSYDEVEAMDDF